MRLRLYANSLSPFVRKVRIVLHEKRVAFDTVEIEHGADRDALLRVNPRGEVPVLVDGDLVVTGSAAICDYVEATHPQPALLPAEPGERARVKWLEAVADTHTDALQFFAFLLAARRPELRDEVPSAAQALAHAVRQHYAFLDRRLAGGDYLAGDLSRADVAFVPHVTSLGVLGEPVPDDCAHVKRWLDRMLSRPSVRQDAAEARRVWAATATNPDPFFRADRIHWRGERVEWALRLGLGPWLLREIEAGRAYFSPAPDDRWATA
jgi:glutathione S-transferase